MRVLILVHEDLVPSSGRPVSPRVQTEHDVVEGLQALNHEVIVLGVGHSLSLLRRTIQSQRPHIIFNLLEEFAGKSTFEPHIVSYLEMLNIPYTGCNPKGLQLAKDKAITKALLRHHGIATPDFRVVPRGRRLKPGRLKFPLIVKALQEEASRGLTLQSVVWNAAELDVQIQKVHEKLRNDALVEEYIDGREFYLGVLGNGRVKTLPIWELRFGNIPKSWPRVATERIKWRHDIQKKYFIESGKAENVLDSQVQMMRRMAKAAYEILGLNGYARMDFRMNSTGKVYFLEANPNPNIGATEDFALSASTAGLAYPLLLEQILKMGKTWHQTSVDR